jgi:YidC/Oxa1 family membrane protein insertase
MMDLKRLVLYAALALIGVMLWNSWNKDYPAQKVETVAAAQDQASQTDSGYVPPVFNPAVSSPEEKAKSVAAPSVAEAPKNEQLVEIKTDVLDIAINTIGGNIVSAKLPKYPESLNKQEGPIQILKPDPSALYITQDGITNVSKKGLPKPIVYQTEKKQYMLGRDQNEITVVLTGKTESGLDVQKTYTLKKGHYDILTSYKLQNVGKTPWTGSIYYQIVRKNTPGEKAEHSRSYDGPAISSPEKPYEKIPYKKLDKSNLNEQIKGGWVAMQQAYFLTSWVPSQEETSHFYSHVEASPDEQNIYTLGFVTPEIALEPGKSMVHSAILYVGPEIADQLAKIAKGLDLTVDYGFLWPIAKVIFIAMQYIHKIVGNWGWSIILVTLLIKIIFYPLSNKSYQSMVRMRELQPRMEAIKARFANDKQAQGKAIMDFYKKEKVNPMGGCLPMLIQFPVFIALYYVLSESVELRQAPFMFWIHDLSVKDPFYILPLLMGASMFIQQKLSPAPPDPTQAKMMMFLPVVVTIFFITLPSGLALYMLTNNILSILQQWYVMKTYKPSKAKTQKKKRKGGGIKSLS